MNVIGNGALHLGSLLFEAAALLLSAIVMTVLVIVSQIVRIVCEAADRRGRMPSGARHEVSALTR